MINWKNGFLKEFGIIQYSSLEVGNMLKLFEVPPSITGADPGFFLGGGALVCCSTSTPINHMVFLFLQNTSCIRKRQVISGGGGGGAPPAPCITCSGRWPGPHLSQSLDPALT